MQSTTRNLGDASARARLQQQMAAYRHFIVVGGNPKSRKGKYRRRQIARLAERIREEKRA